ncbi:hypothetical protein BDZ85DRAFT_191410 [Elsinoe ampelina]|uniref:Uncharacterized protein n=1 Tax=Elsinoe ampelina TaxID=302913 RepID=A0A6A6GMF4_9PEZI|nr:hypothetical protein BDZ85DRAFT_191410 [Elsinoe ampelina]
MAAVLPATTPLSHIREEELKAAISTVTEVDSSDSEAEFEHAPSYDLSASHLITSPYPDFANQTRLTDLSLSCRLLSFALTNMAPIRPDYSTADYMESFNWNVCFAELRKLCAQTGYRWQRQEFYVVIFRSKLKLGADRTRLGELDQHSHAEACQSGGLLKYWFGECNGERRNLATCLWRGRDDAIAGGKGPWHAKAMRSAVEMYETISFHRHSLIIEDGAEGWSLEEYSGPGVRRASRAGH